MSPPRATKRVTITDTATGKCRDIPLGEPTKKVRDTLLVGWRLGGLASDAEIKLDEPLHDASLGIYFAGNHIILWGKGTNLPEIALVNHPGRKADTSGGAINFRFDGQPLRIGRHVLELGG